MTRLDNLAFLRLTFLDVGGYFSTALVKIRLPILIIASGLPLFSVSKAQPIELLPKSSPKIFLLSFASFCVAYYHSVTSYSLSGGP